MASSLVSDASVYNLKDLSQFGYTKIGSSVSFSLIMLKTFCYTPVHSNSLSFLVRSYSGLAMSAKPLIKVR